MAVKSDAEALPRWAALAFATFAIAAVGTAFGWLHTDLQSVRAETKDTSDHLERVKDQLSDRIDERSTELETTISDLTKQIAILNQRLDDGMPTDLESAVLRARQSLAAQTQGVIGLHKKPRTSSPYPPLPKRN